MYKLSRNQSRQFLFDTWHKYHHKALLSDMEKMALDIILLHPEYHSILDNTEKYYDKDFLPEMGSTNPFLHMSMHIAIKEQLSINQPAGIRDRFNRLQKKNNNEHKTMHQIMECLAEMLWEAQRSQSTPDASIYFKCLDK
tara:strand:+ start:670 stop:1089 length:420 start_codon:yes stop_codon:yes gene_type:complete